jgi:hypothetical protein
MISEIHVIIIIITIIIIINEGTWDTNGRVEKSYSLLVSKLKFRR